MNAKKNVAHKIKKESSRRVDAQVCQQILLHPQADSGKVAGPNLVPSS